MGEIDDLYQQEAEEIDSNFLEKLKKSKNHDKSVTNYLANLKKARNKFKKKYGKFNARESKRIRGIKKIIASDSKFAHLEIEHFDFDFSFWERFKMKWDILLFNFIRKFKRFSSWVLPRWLIYTWFKIVKFSKSSWDEITSTLNSGWETLNNSSIKFGTWVLNILKGIWEGVNILIGKVLFWKKKTEEKKEEGKKEDEKKEP